MIRKLEIMGVLLALHAGCSNQNKKTDPPVDNKDATPIVSTDGPSMAALTDDQLRKLFVDAYYCRGACPERDQFRGYKLANPAQVAGVMLTVMADPASRTDQGPGQEAIFIINEWLTAGPDEAARKRASQALVKVAAEGQELMRYQAYGLLAQYKLPDARQILIAEIENPARDEAARAAAAVALGSVIDDFEFIRGWLRDDKPHHWHAALEMMTTFQAFDADAQERRWDERRLLLIELGKRPDLPAIVVSNLAYWFKIYLEDKPADAEILALVKRWAKHPDDVAAEEMKKLLP